jgi:glycosyltransferase involved in cell wall biosynthesis
MSTARPRILFVGPLPPGEHGAAIINGRLVRGLSRRGHEIHAVAPVVPVEGMRNPGAVLPELSSVWPVALDSQKVLPPGDAVPEVVRTYASRMADILPDVVVRTRPDLILFGNEFSTPAVTALEPRSRVPTIAIVHSAASTMLGTEGQPEPGDAILPALRNMDAVVAVARHLRDALHRFGLDNVSTIANSVDFTRFRPRNARPRIRRHLGYDDRDVVVLHASSFRPLKRPVDILRSAALALRANPRLRYVIAGRNTDAAEVAAMHEASRQLACRVHYPGWRPHGAMPFHYAAADILASIVEAAPLAVLEAQASGCPVVASDIPANRELVEHGRTGLLYPLGDVPALADATVRLTEDRDLRETIGAEAQAWIRTHRDPDRWLDAYASLIADVVNAGRIEAIA